MITQTHNKLNALIVDDEKDICFLLSNILKQKNYNSTLAGSLAEAQKLIETQTPSIIFLDNHLPDGLGLDHIHELKKNSPFVKLVMITAHDNANEKRKAMEQGADHFISKPFSRELIFQALKQCG